MTVSRLLPIPAMKLKDLVKVSVLAFILLFTSYEKYKVFDEAGGDFEVYRKASIEFLHGINPYEYTVKSYKDDTVKDTLDSTQPKNEDLGHGYAYLPGLLYIQAPLYLVFENFDIPLQRLWRAPVLFADLGVSILLILFFYKRNYLATVISVLAWSFHPFFLIRGSYTNTEPLPVFFVMLALYFLEKKEILSALSFSVAVTFKTFPIMFLPIFLLKTKTPIRFLFVGLVFFLLISLPFMSSWENFWTYIQGSLLVHGERVLQGRPLLSYIQVLSGFNFYQVTGFKFYVYFALLLGPITVLLFHYKKKTLDKYVLALVTFGWFYIFTPVLSRTHFIWLIPVYLIGIYKIFETKKYGVCLFYFLSILFYVFYAWYLNQWVRGFRFVGDQIQL